MYVNKSKDCYEKEFKLLSEMTLFNNVNFKNIATLMICEYDVDFCPEDYVHLFKTLNCNKIKIIKTKKLDSILPKLDCLRFLFPHLFIVILSTRQMETHHACLVCRNF